MPEDLNPLSKQSWKRSASGGGPGWTIAGLLLALAIVKFILEELGIIQPSP